jgi:signal transduction histidine kinase
MTRDDAFAALSSDATEDRLRGARFFSRNAVMEDVLQIKATLRRETVPWVRRALQSAIARAEQDQTPSVPVDGTTNDQLEGLDARQIYAKAAEEVANSLIHELAPVVGLLRVVLPTEMNGGYEKSESRKYVNQLHSLMTAIRALKRANALPTYQELQLADFISGLVETVPNPNHVDIQLVGPNRLKVSADSDQLTLAIVNGLRNALEAVRTYSTTDPPRIAITWGNTQSDNYVVIKDSGPGFQGDPSLALKLGATTKDGHVGFGLALAHQAMMSMQGDITIKNDEDGAHFEIRWFRDNEDSIR